MDRAEFERHQYIALREEVCQTKARIFYIAAIALFVVPGGQYLARTMDAELVLLALPFLVICVALLYLSENHALMRCGRYIRLYVEEPIDDVHGWEEWLESKDSCEPRNVDRYVSYSLYLLLLTYYAASVIIADRAIVKSQAMTSARYPALGVYLGVGAFFLLFLLRTIRSTTSTSYDPPSRKNRQGTSAAS
jgi:hypothetical protein